MIIKKSFKLRVYPSKKQEAMMSQFIGSCRWLWNYLLEVNNKKYEEEHKFIFKYDMSKMIPKIKKEFVWLNNCPASSLQRIAINLDKALRKFIADNSGYPKFKKRNEDTGSFYISNQAFRFKDNRIILPKIGLMRFRCGEFPSGKILSATISKEGAEWYCSVACEIVIDQKEKDISYETCVGIDVGIKELITLSSGKTYKNKRYAKNDEKKIRRLQKKLNKTKHGGRNRKKIKEKLFIANQKIRNRRRHYLHTITSEVVKKHSIICVENLDIIPMMKRKYIASSLTDAALSEIIRQLEYKSLWNNTKLIKLDRYFPSSQICSACGCQKKISLATRTFICPACGNTIDRDLNAAINIKKYGWNKIGSMRPESVVTMTEACGDMIK